MSVVQFLMRHAVGLFAGYIAVVAVCALVICWGAEPDPGQEP